MMNNDDKVNFSPKARRAPGLTRHNPYSSLHGARINARQGTRESQQLSYEDVNAPPKGSSDEDSEVEDDSRQRAGKSKSKSKSPNARKSRESAGTSSPREEVAATDVKHPINITREISTSKKPSESRNGSQESQKRRKEAIDKDEDMLDMWGSQKKKVKRSQAYGGRSSQQPRLENPHIKPTKDSSDFPKRNAASVKVSGDGFKTLLVNGETPRSQRASQRSFGGTQGSSQATPKKVFKKPPRVSPQNVPKFETVETRSGEGVVERKTRSSAPGRKPCEAITSGQTYEGKVSDAIFTATEKLGVSGSLFKPPPSSKAPSSLPLPSYDDSSGSSPLSSPPPEIEAIEGSPSLSDVESVTNAAVVAANGGSAPRCPLCKEEVEFLFFDEYTGGRRLTIRQQAEFCKAYKKHKAEAEWRKQGFPEIEWQCLDERLNTYHHAIDDILRKERFSFYRNVFEDMVKRGDNRTLRKTVLEGDEFEDSIPGYYGSRGARVMMENIMTRFASKLRRLAATDKLISTGGVSGYVHAVLVPELGMLLIKDDMSVGEEKAREILRNSVDIGNLLNDEEDEIIVDPAGDGKAIWDLT